MLRSPIYRRLPVRERARLDRAIILRPAGCKSIDAIAEHFHLVEKYGISVTALRTYAGKLEEFVKPTLTSQVLAGVLGCLPVSYRRRLVAGSEVMLVSRILQALNDEKMGLTVAELARLGSILSGLARRGAASNRPAGRGKPSGTDARPDESADRNGPDPVKMARTVRLLYGLSWPLSGTGRDGDGGGSGPSSPDGNRPSEAVRRSEEDPSHVHPEEGTP
ncbi:MAG: hypothetical protein HY718_02060 [Planctomycetes bacterium]|nr:hypothetical protein [Planctomycetota bacterium]